MQKRRSRFGLMAAFTLVGWLYYWSFRYVLSLAGVDPLDSAGMAVIGVMICFGIGGLMESENRFKLPVKTDIPPAPATPVEPPSGTVN